MTKCEFCDISLKSDLDVSKHLFSDTHRENVKKATSLHPLEKSTLRDDHTNIVKVFESLKLRTAKDVRDLADKNYFNIPEDKTDILGVADKMTHVFLKCIAEHRTRKSSPKTRKIIMDSFAETKSTKSRSQASEPTETRAAPQPEAQRLPEVERPRPQVSPLITNTVRPSVGQQVPDFRRPQSPVVAPQPPIVVPTPERRMPPETDRSRPVPASQPLTARPADRPRPPESTLPRARDPADGQPRVYPSMASMNSPPTKRKPPPEAAEIRPPAPQTTGPPQPRKDSTYVIKLGTIKVEPKDD